MASLRAGAAFCRQALGERWRGAELVEVTLAGLDEGGVVELREREAPAEPARFACVFRAPAAAAGGAPELRRVVLSARDPAGRVEPCEAAPLAGLRPLDVEALMTLRDLAAAAAAVSPDPGRPLRVAWPGDQAEPVASLDGRTFAAAARRRTLRQVLEVLEAALQRRQIRQARWVMIAVDGLDAEGRIDLHSPRTHVACTALAAGSLWHASLSAGAVEGRVDEYPVRLTSAQQAEHAGLVLDAARLLDSSDLVRDVARQGPVPPHLAIYVDPRDEPPEALARFYEQVTAGDYRDETPRVRVRAYSGEVVPLRP